VVADEQDETLAEAFWAVARQLRALSREGLARWDVTPSQSRALGVLARHEQLRLSELADQLRIVARSATEVVDGLQERGLVERLPDPHDRRATLVRLTAAGTEVAAAIRAARATEAEGYFAALDDADRAELARLLRTLRS
jgi:DNA-binding MarR family transcriptional regulator